MTSRSEAEALRSLIDRLNELVDLNYGAAEKLHSVTAVGAIAEALVDSHIQGHAQEMERLTMAVAFYKGMLAQAEEREHAS